MNKLFIGFIDGFIGFTSRSLVKNLFVISMCILLFFVQVFYPYNHFSLGNQNENSEFRVGIHYVYEQDDLGRIYGEVQRIYDLGFKVVRITLECNQFDFNDLMNQKTDEFFLAVNYYSLDVALVIKNLDPFEKVDYWLGRWGIHLAYVQVFNEPELSSTWDVGALFTDDEIFSKFEKMIDLVESHNLSAKLYTNFSVGYVLRSNVPIELSKRLDFVGLDIFMDAFLILSPHFIQNLQKITQKEVVITEFGMSTSNSLAQSDYLIKGLSLFKSMGLNGCWIVYWNSDYDSYDIRGRLAEKAVGEWIAQNAN
jgi:hypothetical protein